VKDYRQLAKLWGRDYVQESMLASYHDRDLEHDELGDNVGWATSILDRQMGHSSETTTARYGRLLTTPFFGKPGQPSVKDYLVGSIGWWRFVGFPMGKSLKMEEGDDVEAGQSKIQKSLLNEFLELQSSLGELGLLATLRRMLRLLHTKFRSKQLQALEAIVAGFRCVVAVIPTAGGKSMLYQLPAFSGLAGLTIVVTPYVALEHDQAQRCVPYRIPYAIWDSENPHKLPRQLALLFVTPESFVTSTFQQYMSQAMASYRLQRVVIDEFHECRSEFRKAQRLLADNIDHTVQIVAMTATLAPTEETEILQLFDLPRDHATIVRDVTTQKQHQYGVVKIPKPCDQKEGLLQRVGIIKDRMAEIERTHSLEAQFLILCDTKKQTEELAKALRVAPYWSRIENGEELMSAFLAGKIKVLPCTSAASCGLDGKGRIFVICDGAPKTLQ
jgi:superfamily II DNA helicase RecQ